MPEEFKIIQMYNSTGAQVFPKTKAEIVAYDATTSIKDKIDAVAAAGELNVLEAVKWNGEAFTITDKAVDIYSKVSTFVSTEIGKQIHMNVIVGKATDIDTPPTKADLGKIVLIPVADDSTLSNGTYIEYVAATVPGTDGAADTYVWEQIGTTAVDLTGYATEGYVNGEIDKLANVYAAKGTTEAHINNSDIHVTAAQKTAWDAYATGKQDTLTTDQLAAVNSGITATKVATYDGYEATINSKANAADVYTKGDAENMAAGKASAAIEALNLPNTYAAKSYEKTIDDHIADGDIHVTTAQKAEWSGKQDALTTDQLDAIADVANKADKTITVGTQTLSVLYFEEITA